MAKYHKYIITWQFSPLLLYQNLKVNPAILNFPLENTWLVV